MDYRFTPEEVRAVEQIDDSNLEFYIGVNRLERRVGPIFKFFGKISMLAGLALGAAAGLEDEVFHNGHAVGGDVFLSVTFGAMGLLIYGMVKGSEANARRTGALLSQVHTARMEGEMSMLFPEIAELEPAVPELTPENIVLGEN